VRLATSAQSVRGRRTSGWIGSARRESPDGPAPWGPDVERVPVRGRIKVATGNRFESGRRARRPCSLGCLRSLFVRGGTKTELSAAYFAANDSSFAKSPDRGCDGRFDLAEVVAPCPRNSASNFHSAWRARKRSRLETGRLDIAVAGWEYPAARQRTEVREKKLCPLE
jgi:hypothetical protein